MARSPIGESARLFVWQNGTLPDLNSLGALPAVYTSPTDGERLVRDTAIAALPVDAGADSWLSTCPVDVSFTGGTETADDSDRCNPDSTVVTKTTFSINFNFKKRKTTGSELPSWIKVFRKAWNDKEVIAVLMVDTETINTTGADGFWIIGAVTDYSENQPLTESIDISLTIVPGSTPVRAAAPQVPYKNRDVFSLFTQTP